MTTINIEKRKTYPVDAEHTWSLISDFYALHTWLPAVTDTRREDATRSRIAVLPGGGEVVEQLLDVGQYFHRYRVTGGPMPVTGFVAEIRVHARTETTSEIVWQAEFQPSGIPAADAEGVVAGVFDGGLDNLASLIARETAPAD
ncbi:SRPBCC family protein [Streptomyces libani]|uniref:SRPBCC family protein n=1 Tax=Streptomyces nigrescens TaxID=1920 RepID=UPI003821E2B9